MRNYVIGTSDHSGRHLNMVQAENVQAALEMCGVLDLGKIPRRDMETHADVDYIYVEEPTGAVVDPVITRGTSPVQEPVTILHNFADRFVASQKPLPPENYAILEKAVQAEFDKCENEHVIPYPEIRTVGDLKAILANIPDNYAVTLGSDSVAVPDGSDRIGTTYDHGAYEVDTSVSHITTLQANRELRELYIGLTLLLNNLRV